MTPKLGRNDPCHCGSGKKYKRCHLAEDEQRERDVMRDRLARLAPAVAGGSASSPLPLLGVRDTTPYSLPDVSNIPPLTPEEQEEFEAESALLNRFEAADFAEQIRIFLEQWPSSNLDVDLVWEMLNEIHAGAVAHGERHRWRELAERVREQRPDIFEKDRFWFLETMISDAAALGDYDEVARLAPQVSDRVEELYDDFMRLVDLLMFHAQRDTAIDLMTRAWPLVRDSSEILELGKTEFKVILLMLLVIRHVESGRPARADDPELRAALAPLGELNEERIPIVLGALSGALWRDWSPADFPRPTVEESEDEDEEWDEPEAEGDTLHVIEPSGEVVPFARRSDAEPAGGEEEEETEGVRQAREALASLLQLSLEWSAWLQREHGVPFTRTELVRDTLTHFQFLEPPDRAGHVQLLPTKRAIEQRIAALMSYLSGQPYKAGTLFALLPWYCDFLAERGLVKRDAARRARADILTLRDHVRRLVDEFTVDPVLVEAVQRAGLL